MPRCEECVREPECCWAVCGIDNNCSEFCTPEADERERKWQEELLKNKDYYKKKWQEERLENVARYAQRSEPLPYKRQGQGSNP